MSKKLLLIIDGFNSNNCIIQFPQTNRFAHVHPQLKYEIYAFAGTDITVCICMLNTFCYSIAYNGTGNTIVNLFLST